MKITFIRGDIAAVEADAVVNAANSSLLGGGGVDGAIHRAAGPGLLAECRKLREESLHDGLPAGQAAITSAHGLAAQWIVHAVGPNKNAGETDVAVLESAFRSALDAADRVGAHSVAMPAIGAGAYGWSGEEAAAAARRAIESRPEDSRDNVGEVLFVLFSEELEAVFRAEFEGWADDSGVGDDPGATGDPEADFEPGDPVEGDGEMAAETTGHAEPTGKTEMTEKKGEGDV